jgi:hypothetical protein
MLPIGRIRPKSQASLIGTRVVHGIRASRATNRTVQERINNYMKPKTLEAARAEIDSLKAQLAKTRPPVAKPKPEPGFGPVKSLQEAKPYIEKLEAELKASGTETPERPEIRTLGAAKDYIEILEKLKRPETAQKLPTTVEPVSAGLFDIEASSRRVAALSAHLPAKVAAKLQPQVDCNGLMAVQAALDKAKDPADKIQVLQSAADNFRAQAAKAKNMSIEQLDLLKMKAKCETRLAYELKDQGKLRSYNKPKPADLA